VTRGDDSSDSPKCLRTAEPRPDGRVDPGRPEVDGGMGARIELDDRLWGDTTTATDDEARDEEYPGRGGRSTGWAAQGFPVRDRSGPGIYC
jgi:hypothetical protein